MRGLRRTRGTSPIKLGLSLKELKDVRSGDDTFKGAIDDYGQLVYILAAHDLQGLHDRSIDRNRSKLIQRSHDYIESFIRPL